MASITPTSVEASRPEPDLSGRQLGPYRLLRRLGRGGMADVYLAEQSSLQRQVALKVLKSSLADDAHYVRRFHHEAQAAASLVHANIVQIHEVGCVEGVHYIAQEYVAGQNLRQLLARRAALDAATVASILRQTAAALHKASQQGIVHRDIKPENIMVSPEGEVKVADFGLARAANNGAAMNLTQAGVTMGTPLYMSPEQVEGRPLDPRSDLYSLGVTVYHLLAGRPPFDGETPLAIALQHLKKQPERLENLRPDVPEGLCRIVHRMLAKEPAERFPSAAELLKELRALQLADGAAWGADEDWSTSELLALTSARTQATQQLETLMKAEGDESSATPSWWGAALLVLAALAVGGATAVMSREPPLLAPSRVQAAQVEKMKTAEAQYRHATLLRSEAGWKSVLEHFPADESELNKYYARRALQQLARLYWERDDLDQALATFTQLARSEASEGEFIAFGLAGQALVYQRRDDRPRLAETMARLEPYRERDQLRDPNLRSEIERLLRGQEE